MVRKTAICPELPGQLVVAQQVKVHFEAEKLGFKISFIMAQESTDLPCTDKKKKVGQQYFPILVDFLD